MTPLLVWWLWKYPQAFIAAGWLLVFLGRLK